MKTLVANAILSRTAWLCKLLDPRRDIDKECGHPDSMTVTDYARLFSRGDVAGRVVSLFPDESWSNDPAVYESEDEKDTEFELAWEQLTKDFPLFSYLHRADTLSGIGRFGVILLGIDDGLPLNLPVAEISAGGQQGGQKGRRLLYLRPLDETVVKVKELERDTMNPRYGLPLLYDVSFVESAESSDQRSVPVHWSRIIHLTDNRTNSEIYGAPRMELVVNRLLDLRKIAGGSGEMFWKGGFPGLSLETQSGLDNEVEIDATATKEQMDAYQNGLQRYLFTSGLTANSLTVQVADPTPHMTVQLKLISIALAVPWRVLVGSEAAQLASEQDSRSWNRRVMARRETYLTPFVLRPFVERLIFVGILPAPKKGFIVDWPDLNAMTDKEKADIGKVRTDALAAYTASGLDTLISPFLYFTLFQGMSDAEAEAIVDTSETNLLAIDRDEDEDDADEEV